jgi:hypothetical protein
MRGKLAFSTAVVFLAGVTGACKGAGEAKSKETTAVPGVVESRGALAMRREAQEHLDKARERFVQKDMTTAATELRAASTFLRERADSATGEVRDHMLRSAGELDKLANEVESNAIKSAKSLDYAFARAQHAEAELHHSHAVAAWARKDMARASDELTMATDHFERAAKDAGEVLGAGAKKALTDTREVAGQLTKGVGFVPEQVGKAIEELGKEIRILGTKIEKRGA